MKKKILISLACALVLMFAVAFTACTEKNSNTTPTTSVDIIVYDAQSQPLSGATVSLCTTGGQSVTTNTLGAATLTKIAPGNHMLQIAKDGYATILEEVSLSVPDIVGDIAFALHGATIVTLPKLGAVVKGTVDINNGSSTLPLVGAELKLMLTNKVETSPFMATSGTVGSFEWMPPSEFATGLYTATSGAGGNFEFSNLPENTSYTIFGASESRDNIIYTMDTRTGTTGFLWDDAVPLTNNLLYSAAAGQFRATVGDTTLVAKYAPIIVNFSQPVDLTVLDGMDIHVRLDGSSSNIQNSLVNMVWSNDNKRLTISPATGRWNANYTVVLYLNSVRSESGVNLPYEIHTFSFDTDISLESVGAISLTETSNLNSLSAEYRNRLELTWVEVAGATGYEVYIVDSLGDVTRHTGRGYLDEYGNVIWDLITYTRLDHASDFVTNSSYVIYVYAYNDLGARSPASSKVVVNTVA